MPKLKKFDFPNVSIEEAIRAVTVLIDKLGGETKKADAFASLIGHSSAKSGTFLLKLGDIRKYGLLEPRGDIKATELAKKLVHPINPQERQLALNEMIMNVELWRLLYDKIGKKYPADEEFWVHIMEVTNTDRNEASSAADKIRKKYKEVMSYYHKQPQDSQEIEEAGEEELLEVPSYGEETVVNKSNFVVPKGVEMIEAKSGNVFVAMPKNLKSVEIAKKLIDILSLQIESEQQE